jgi:hypothetical protein
MKLCSLYSLDILYLVSYSSITNKKCAVKRGNINMKLTTLLRLQIIYFVLGMLYNGVSMYLSSQGKPALAPTKPVLGAISMITYALFLIPGYLPNINLYRILMGIAIVVMGYGGVVTHIINIFIQPQVYSSIVSWAAAVSINLFGLVLNIIAVSGKFKR